MLRIFILIILSVQVCFLSISQNYAPMLGELNEWRVTSCFSGCNSSTYYTDGDTIVEGKSYKILDGYHFSSRTFLLREDVQSKQIHMAIVNPDRVDEFLMYDFSLEVGDSIDLVNPVSPFPLIAGYYQVDSIVSHPLEDAQNYRYFYLSPTASNTQTNETPIWIESVGSLSLINGPGATPDFNGGGQLSCYFKDGESRYYNSDSIQSCQQEHFLAVSDLTNELFFNIYPNPAAQNITVSTSQNGNFFIEIVDLSGKLEQRTRLKNNQDLELRLEPGIYIVKLLDESHYLASQKLIISP